MCFSSGDREVYALLRSFLTHSKSSRLTDYQLRSRAGDGGASAVRAAVFLDVFLPLRQAWNQRLQDSGTLDFDDMINQATDLITSGKWTSPHELVMVDELQDTSAARADLISALVDPPHRYLFAVGDDWQSINRFAGADVSVMTRFDDRFDPGHTVHPERTFRSPKSLCDVAGRFISRNPTRLTKTVIFHQPDHPPTVHMLAADPEHDTGELIRRHLDHLETEAATKNALRSHSHSQADQPRQATVLILSRYRRPAR